MVRAIDASGLTFAYPTSDRPALDGVEIRIDEGEFVAVVGPPGSGKTTLAYTLSGVIPHLVKGSLAGEVKLFGRRTRDMSLAELPQVAGIILQKPENQLFSLRVLDEVAFGPQNLGVPRSEVLERTEWALGEVRMRDHARDMTYELSDGQGQRVATAAALAMKPRILVLDEPCSMLDPQGKNEVYTLLRELADEGVAIVLVDQDVDRIAEFADRVVILSGGRVTMDGSAIEVLSRVSELHRLHVKPPDVTELCYRLFGNNAGQLPITVDEAENYLLRAAAAKSGGQA